MIWLLTLFFRTITVVAWALTLLLTLFINPSLAFGLLLVLWFAAQLHQARCH